MAICPFAKQQLIPAGANDPPIVPRLAILHVAVSMAESLYRFFRFRSGGIESTFYINWRGKLIQYRDTRREADANFGANDIAVSIETAGFALGKWNPFQKRKMKRLLLWLNRVEDIPLVVPDNARGSGVGYHVQFGSPGGWTNVAKSCPGKYRVKQYWNWLVPWMKSTHYEWGELIVNERDEQIIRNVVREELRKPDLNTWGFPWRMEVLVRALVGLNGGSAHTILERARKARKRRR